MNYERDYRKKILQPDNEKKLNELRRKIVHRIYNIGYDVPLAKVIQMLDIWFEWQRKRRYKYQYQGGCLHSIVIKDIFNELTVCDEAGDDEFIHTIYYLVKYHVKTHHEQRFENLQEERLLDLTIRKEQRNG